MINLPSLKPHLEKFQKNRFAVIPNFIESNLILSWREISNELVRKFGLDIRKNIQNRTLSYRVVLGDVIQNHFSELMNFYLSENMRCWISELAGENKLYTSDHLSSAININYMDKPVDRYPWHFDVVAYTALLYLTDTSAEDGGFLEICLDQNNLDQKFSIQPEAGTLIVMDGTTCYHSVSPLLSANPRISIPMVYPIIPNHERPKDVDDFIYNK